MIQGQLEPPGQQLHLPARRSRLLQRYPVLLPFVLVSSSLGLCIVSFFTDTLFPLLALLGLPTALLCLSVAFVLGIAGILTSIVSILESIDRCRLRHRLPAATFPKPKGA